MLQLSEVSQIVVVNEVSDSQGITSGSWWLGICRVAITLKHNTIQTYKICKQCVSNRNNMTLLAPPRFNCLFLLGEQNNAELAKYHIKRRSLEFSSVNIFRMTEKIIVVNELK